MSRIAEYQQFSWRICFQDSRENEIVFGEAQHKVWNLFIIVRFFTKDLKYSLFPTAKDEGDQFRVSSSVMWVEVIAPWQKVEAKFAANLFQGGE